jgi:hypothetical protein
MYTVVYQGGGQGRSSAKIIVSLILTSDLAEKMVFFINLRIGSEGKTTTGGLGLGRLDFKINVI